MLRIGQKLLRCPFATELYGPTLITFYYSIKVLSQLLGAFKNLVSISMLRTQLILRLTGLWEQNSKRRGFCRKTIPTKIQKKLMQKKTIRALKLI